MCCHSVLPDLWLICSMSDLFPTTLQASNTYHVACLTTECSYDPHLLNPVSPTAQSAAWKNLLCDKKGHVFNPPPCGWTALGVFGQSQQFLTLEFFVALRPGPRNHPTCNADCEHLGRQNNNFLDPTILKISKNFHLPQTRTFSKFSPVELFFVIAKRRRVSAMR